MSEQGTPIPGEGEGGSTLSPQQHEEIVREQAAKKGWAPLEQWKGNPEDWVDAKEFVGRQKLYDRISDLKGALTKQQQAFQSDMKLVVENMAKIRDAEYKRALKDLEAQRQQAVDADDAREAVRISQEIEEVKQARAEEKTAIKEAPVAQTGPTQEFIEWESRNSWFKDNQEMRNDALSIGVGYSAGNPNKTQSEVLAYVENRIKRMYPEEFGQKPERKQMSAVEGAGVPSQKQVDNNGRRSKITLDDLPEEHRVVARTIIKSGALKAAAEKNKRSEVEEYLAQYKGD